MKSSLAQFWERFKSRHTEIEVSIAESPGSYAGSSLEALYTSPDDLSAMFFHPEVTGTFADLGCGSGFSAILYGSMFPERRSIGVEREIERLHEGLSFLIEEKLTNVDLLPGDLLEIDLPVADTYFLYMPTGPVLDRILSVLYHSQRMFKLLVVESHGDLIPRVEMENWLTLAGKVPLTSPRHHPEAKIFVRNKSERKVDLIPFEHSFRDHYLLIQDEMESWLGRTMGMEWTNQDRFELVTPPRTIYWKNVKKLFLTKRDCGELYTRAIDLWDKGEVTLRTEQRTFRGHIRKIIISPSFKVEISTGEKVEWTEILEIFSGT